MSEEEMSHVAMEITAQDQILPCPICMQLQFDKTVRYALAHDNRVVNIEDVFNNLICDECREDTGGGIIVISG